MWSNILVAAIILLIIGFAVYKIISEKKAGAKCVGCPYAGKCTSNICPSDFVEYDENDNSKDTLGPDDFDAC